MRKAGMEVVKRVASMGTLHVLALASYLTPFGIGEAVSCCMRRT